jgi:glycosyltransferase involved in cell wall biosynthesis
MEFAMKSKRILIAPCEIAGYYANLAKGFNEIGVYCDYITYAPHPFGYGGETKTPFLLRLARYFDQFRGKPNRPFILKLLIASPSEILQQMWALTAIFRYDVFVLTFGRSLIRGKLDLILLRYLKKRLLVVYHGSDSRPAYIDGFIHHPFDHSKSLGIQEIRDRTHIAARSVRRFEECGVLLIGNPFSVSQFASKKCINFLTIGLPFPAIKNRDEGYDPDDFTKIRPVRVLHSPSHPVSKGSKQIQLAISRLKAMNYNIDYVELSGKSHDQVIQEIIKCDFVVDQVYSDFPLAGFATEAAWFGKPAVVGGYSFEYLKSLVPTDMWPPSRICHPDEIEKAIESMIVNREERLRLGAEAQKFVREKWNAADVARRYLRIIEGDIPDEWWLDPRRVTYPEGGGQPIERSKENIRQMVEQFGVESLQLSHRPDLEQAFVEFAEIKPKIDA